MMNVDTTWCCRSGKEFERLKFVGEGTYGVVYKVRDKESGGVYAMKKIKLERETEGFPLTSLREIRLLKQLNHPNIVKLHGVVTSKSASNQSPGNVSLLFEYTDYDLEGLLLSKSPVIHFTVAQLKCLIKQILQGVEYLHSRNIIHRDLKCANLLVNRNGLLKLADFGLARTCSPTTCTNKVITIWYRPPELLLGSTNYACEVDMWSVGCIIGEMLSRIPLFPEPDETQILRRIWRLCGTPTDESWPGHTALPLFNTLRPLWRMPRRLRQVYAKVDTYPNFDAHAIDLIDKLLVLNPAQRLTAAEALKHPYFTSEPLPCEPEELPKLEFEIHGHKARRQRKKLKKETLPKKRAPSNSNESPTHKRKPN